MSTRTLYEIKDMLCRELDEYAEKGELSAGSLETIHKLTDTIKNIDKIYMIDKNGGYSSDGEWEAYGTYDMGNSRNSSYNGTSRDGRRNNSSNSGASYRGGNRRGTHYVRSHYSRDDARDMIMGELREAENMAQNDRERRIIRECMDKLENS